MKRRTSAPRAVAAAVTTWAVTAGLARTALDRAPDPARPDEVVTAVVVGLGAVAALVLALGCTALALAAVASLAGRTAARLHRFGARLTPALLRRALAVSLTAGVGLGVAAGPAAAGEVDLGWLPTDPAATTPVQDAGAPADDDVADPGGTHDLAVSAVTGDEGSGAGDAHVDEDVEGETSAPAPDSTAEPATVPVVEREAVPVAAVVPVAGPAPTAAPAAGTTDPADTAEGYVVRPGDTLWGVAAAHLPAGATEAEVAAEWPRWWAANRDVVGPDPDLIHPGQVLQRPVDDTAGAR